MGHKRDRKISEYRIGKPRNRKKTILIAFEGKNATESLYFKNFNDRNKPYNIIMAKGNCTDPVNLVKSLIKQMKYQEIKVEDGNKVYCVFDTDEDPRKNEQIKEATILAKSHEIEVITSSPCFEDWILCHFEKTTSKLTNKEAFEKVVKHIPKYKKSYDIYNDIYDKTEVAIKNAKFQEKYHLKSGRNIKSTFANPSTEVYRIVEYIK